ncbi:BrnA antitoxin family protein [Azonexus sp. IMCC34839]|uniref:BrnA antitoxin family protein n=1 Tax=Azonexus sp. IMCC34839 TaxID=3133695 RepID=UPI003999B323
MKTYRPRSRCIDPDDAPEPADDFFDLGEWKIGERPVSAAEGAAVLQKALTRGRQGAGRPKVLVTARFDADIVESFKATGKGWQTRMNSALRDWLKTHSP